MSRTEERRIVETWRGRTAASGVEKREAIAEYLGMLGRASHIEPSRGAKMLAALWEAKRRLDWACTPLVTVKA